jgi:hypothetical protein
MQRQTEFKGGIQSGTVATDTHARYLDTALKEGAKLLAEELKSQGYTCETKFGKKFLVERGILIGCAPDGSIWYKNGIPIVAIEGKKQGKGGNAIERWNKNYNICRSINPDIRYITFGAREGFEPDGYPYKYAKTQLALEGKTEFNKLYPNGQSWFINPNGFTQDEAIDIMRQAILGIFK